MSFDDRQGERGDARPRGPWDAPPRPTDRAPQRPRPVSLRTRTNLLSTIAFVIIVLSVGVRAFRDLSRPDAWAYWKDLYFSPSLTSSVIADADLDGRGHTRPALVINGKIGPASASWLRGQLDEAHLAPGDLVVMSSQGGNLVQAMIMGEVIRARGLGTAVGTVDASGRIRPSYCASACVFVFAGGTTRYGIDGARLGVHRFVSNVSETNAVADTQRTTGEILRYMTRMGISSSAFVEAMTATGDIRWLGTEEAASMNLVTAPVRTP